jgi:hypothetical protein
MISDIDDSKANSYSPYSGTSIISIETASGGVSTAATAAEPTKA